jgi:hypothetical protein
MHTETACQALRAGMCLMISYDGYTRVVEVHAVGFTKEGNAVMRVWQIRGGSVSNEPVGWKLLRLDEARAVGVTSEASAAPRRGYRKGDRDMALALGQAS